MVELEAVTRHYGAQTGCTDITFTAGAGEILGLLGPNGAGKTTVLRLITGGLRPHRGRIKISDTDLWQKPDRACPLIGFLPHRPPLYPEMTVQGYIHFVAALRGVTRANLRDQVQGAIHQLDLEPAARRLIGNLSRGFQQRVGLAQAIVHDPPVLVLDEPTAGLDPRQISEFRNLIQTLGRGRTVIISSHSLTEIQVLCHRIAIMHRGRVLALDKPERLAAAADTGFRCQIQVQGRPAAIRSVLIDVPGVRKVDQNGPYWLLDTEPGADVRPELFYRLAAAQLPIIELIPLRSTLETVFLELTRPEPNGRHSTTTA